MAKCRVRYKLLGTTSAGAEYDPFLGTGDREVFLDVGTATSYGVMTIPSATVFPLNISLGVGNHPDMLVIISSVAGTLSWYEPTATFTSENNVSVQIAANFPFIISNPHVGVYDAGAADTDEEATDDNSAPAFYFYHTSLAPTVSVTVFGIGNGDDDT